VYQRTDKHVCVQTVWGFTNGHHALNVHERNEEQGLALWALMNPEIDLVVLSGPAGTGKTLLTLAAGLEQTLPGGRRQPHYDELMFVCGLNPVGKKDIGFLPGTKDEKLEPWMGAVHDNMGVLFHPISGVKDCKRQDAEELMTVEAVMHTRGRTIHRRFLVIDEGQNYTAHEMRTLITRAGEGTKVVVLGNNAQIDNPYVSVHTNGFSYLISQFRGSENFAHVMLKGAVRSRLAQRANELLQ
jgi:PhoH-like ATPase